MASPSYNAKTAQERWHQFSAAAVRAFHRYATWLVSLSWWRFGWYALLLIIATGLIQKLPPFSMTYIETITEAARHHKDKPKAPAMPAMPAAPAIPAAPSAATPAERPEAPERPERPERPEQPERPETPPAGHDANGSRSVNIDLPGITVNTNDRSVKNKGVNITFNGNGIHISTDDTPEEAAAAASAAASAASAAKATAVTAKDRAEAARIDAIARRDAALSKAIAAKAAAEQARAARLAGTAAASAAASAASAAASAAETAVDMVVGGQHIRIAVPSHADAEQVRDAINDAKDSLVQSLKDAEQARRDAEQSAKDASKAAAKGDDGDDSGDEGGDNGDEGDGRRNTTREHTVHYGNLPLLAVWWILGSMLIKITYKGKMQAEVKAAAATETAEAESLRRQVLEARMAMMQAQVEPHFLFNTLASIDHLIEFDPKRASQMQRTLISLLRASMPSMRSTDSGLRPLDLELAVVRPYLEILKVRMEERLTTEIDVPDGLLSAEFPPMMIQTLVENAIKHGLEPKAEGGHLSVKAEIRHGKLCVTVADTGLGFAGAAGGETAGTGIGLANIRERLSLLYGSKGTLTIANNPVGGTIVTITVPYTAHTDTPADEGAKA